MNQTTKKEDITFKWQRKLITRTYVSLRPMFHMEITVSWTLRSNFIKVTIKKQDFAQVIW